MPTLPDLHSWTPERRHALVLSLLRGDTSVAQAAHDHDLPPELILEWERRFLSGASDALRADAAVDVGWHRSRRLQLAVLALALLWLGLRVAYWNGYYTEDAPGYVTDAIYFSLGLSHARDYVTGLNVGTYLPVAIPLRVFGKAEIALSLWPLLCSLLGVASLAGAAAILFGRRLGLLAGLLYATYPGDVFFSTVVMPDAIQAGWLSFSIFLIVLACARPIRYGILGAAGVAMGVCHLIRANGPILLPIGLVAVVVLMWQWRGERPGIVVRGVLTYVSGWLLVQVVEGLAYLWAAGNFFHRFDVVNRHYGTTRSISQWGLNIDFDTIPFSIFPPVLWLKVGGWGQLNQDQAYHGLIFCLALAASVAGVIALKLSPAPVSARAGAGFTLGLFWLAWPLLYHQFGSQSLTHFVPMHRLSRHLVVYAPGAIFVTVAGCALLRTAVSTIRVAAVHRVIAAAALVLLGIHLLLNWQGERLAFHSFHRIKTTYARIRERLPNDVRTIVGDPGDLCFFDFWMNPLGSEPVTMKVFASVSQCDELTDGAVLTRSNPGWDGLSAPIIQETVSRLPCLLNPPASWRLLYDGYPEKVFIVGRPGS